MKLKLLNVFISIICSCFVFSAVARLIAQGYQECERPYFVIVIPSYNNEKYCEKNLKSALDQKYPYYQIIYINDASTDSTKERVEKCITNYDYDNRVTFIHNDINVGPLANIHRAVHMCDSHTVIVILDGDDFLIDDNVLTYLSNVYRDQNVWMTYGQYVHYPQIYRKGGARELPRHVINNHSFREYDWVTTHLRSFYAGLFHKIKKEDLMYEGSFFAMTGDLASTFPMLEMAGEHSKFIATSLYLYNIENPLNENKKNVDYQQHLEHVIRNGRKYTALKTLWS
ncbi:glycosyltransferase family 2 protein [Candidatus Dependentiae bacterium]|nr:glycosyltransferase family 2 protein [Candidatus Dependentiae bacterium]